MILGTVVQALNLRCHNTQIFFTVHILQTVSLHTVREAQFLFAEVDQTGSPYIFCQ